MNKKQLLKQYKHLDKMFDAQTGLMNKCFRENGEAWKLIREMYPKATIIGLYRSAMVILPQTKEHLSRGSVNIILYHDPHWMGEDITKETLKHHSCTMDLYGQRNGPDICINDFHLLLPWEDYSDVSDITKTALKEKIKIDAERMKK